MISLRNYRRTMKKEIVEILYCLFLWVFEDVSGGAIKCHVMQQLPVGGISDHPFQHHHFVIICWGIQLDDRTNETFQNALQCNFPIWVCLGPAYKDETQLYETKHRMHYKRWEILKNYKNFISYRILTEEKSFCLTSPQKFKTWKPYTYSYFLDSTSIVEY